MDYGKEYRDKLAGAVKYIRDSGLVKKPFKVRLVGKDVIGSSVLGDYANGLIRIQRGLPAYIAIDTLLHEVGHHMTSGKHDEKWAAMYSKLYQLYIHPVEKKKEE